MHLDMLLVGLTLAIALVAFGVAGTIFIRLQRVKGVWQIGILFLLEFIYAIGYGLELASDSLELKIFFNHIQYLAIPFIAIAWVYIVNKFHDAKYVPKIWQYAIFLIVPVLTMVTVQLTHYTPIDWFYSSASIDETHRLGSQLMPVLVFTKGPLYYVNTAHNLLLAGFVVYRYGSTFKHSKGIHRQQAFVLMLVTIIGFLASASTFFSKTTHGLDYAFYLIVLIGYLIVYAMFKYELFDLKPNAHYATFEWAPDPVLVLSDAYQLVSWNKAAQDSDIIQPELEYHLPLDQMFSNKELINAVKDHVPHSFKMENRHYVMETIPLTNKKGYPTGYLLKFNEMTSIIERIEKLDYQASHDELTKILNRRAFIEEAQDYIGEKEVHKEPYALLMIDIDDFKVVNDTYGHYYGDLVLEETANIIKENLSSDCSFGRYGGEEFLVLLKNHTKEAAIKKAEVLLGAINSHDYFYNRNHIHIEISIGVCTGEHCSSEDIYSHIQFADKAMYESKQKGKNQVTCALPSNTTEEE
ncbi:MAG: diguanylate cyclase [Candidatus Izemoplasmatales bacterium]|nr:diguanylate cyclase [Candidatus Izemoplasmatales bacterium]